jgi:hypothetical protein
LNCLVRAIRPSKWRIWSNKPKKLSRSMHRRGIDGGICINWGGKQHPASWSSCKSIRTTFPTADKP